MSVWAALGIASGAVAVMVAIMLRAFDIITKLQLWALLSALLGFGAFTWAIWSDLTLPVALFSAVIVVPALVARAVFLPYYWPFDGLWGRD